MDSSVCSAPFDLRLSINFPGRFVDRDDSRNLKTIAIIPPINQFN